MYRGAVVLKQDVPWTTESHDVVVCTPASLWGSNCRYKARALTSVGAALPLPSSHSYLHSASYDTSSLVLAVAPY
jgi:hypothetical protein